MKIDFANLNRQTERYREEIDSAIKEVIDNSSFIMGSAVRELEHNLQNFTKAKHAITCSSGTDALILAMMALGIGEGDEVITTPFTFIATAESIAFLKAKPVFVDIDAKTYNIDVSKIESAITEKTKAIMPVSLYGQPSDISEIEKLKIKYPKLKIIIDGAQSFGSIFEGVCDSKLGDISCTSFFPAKPLGCFGDGGALFIDDDALAEKIKMLRVHGQNKRYHHKYIGIGGRLDTLQAAILNVKLAHYESDLKKRQEVAKKYDTLLPSNYEKPFIDARATSAYAQYSLRVKNRDELQAKLKEQGIPTAVHYPMPLHLQECFAYLGYKKGDFSVAEMVSEEIISLPMNPDLSDEEIEYICEKLR